MARGLFLLWGSYRWGCYEHSLWVLAHTVFSSFGWTHRSGTAVPNGSHLSLLRSCRAFHSGCTTSLPTPTSSKWGFQFFGVPMNTHNFPIKKVLAILVSVKWHLCNFDLLSSSPSVPHPHSCTHAHTRTCLQWGSGVWQWLKAHTLLSCLVEVRLCHLWLGDLGQIP
jgi:hypothetical protein